MGFLGITDVQVLDATQHGADDIEHTVAQLDKQAAVTPQTGAQHG